jgi:phosphoglycerate dehydrogenase-like enzyme
MRLAIALLSCSCALLAQNKKVLISNADPVVLKELQAAATTVRLVPVTPDTLMKEIVDADAFIGEIKPDQVRAGKNLKWVQVMSAGVERVLHLSGGNDLRDSKIILTNNQESNWPGARPS